MTEEKFSGAPFGSNCDRFSAAGLSYSRTVSETRNVNLGPGYYDADNGDFSQKAIARRASGPGWARAYETSHMTALPYLLNKEEWEKRLELKRKLGPGSYNLKDSLETPPEKNFTRGLLDLQEPRFNDCVKFVTPGPGTYGKGGVPHAALEEKERQSFGTIGMLDSGGSARRSLPLVGSHLGPGTYEIPSSIDEVEKKHVGLRGPYDVFSGDRGKPMNTGHHAQRVTYNLGPGQYNLKSLQDELFSDTNKKNGEFGQAAQYPRRPIERIIATTLALRPRDPTEPGPGQYDPIDPNAKCGSSAVKSPPFLSSSMRTDKMATKFFTGNFNPVGPGRYDLHKFNSSQSINGCESSFKSKSGRPSGMRAKALQERLRSKNVPVHQRMFLVPTDEPRRCHETLTVV